jgi:hypothetical protein
MVNRKHEKNGTRGATEIELHTNTLNKKVGFSLYKSWKPFINLLKK